MAKVFEVDFRKNTFMDLAGNLEPYALHGGIVPGTKGFMYTRPATLNVSSRLRYTNNLLSILNSNLFAFEVMFNYDTLIGNRTSYIYSCGGSGGANNGFEIVVNNINVLVLTFQQTAGNVQSYSCGVIQKGIQHLYIVFNRTSASGYYILNGIKTSGISQLIKTCSNINLHAIGSWDGGATAGTRSMDDGIYVVRVYDTPISDYQVMCNYKGFLHGVTHNKILGV